MTSVSTRKPATRKPQIVSTLPLSDGSRCLGSFTFSDGATVRQQGGLVCSQHGRRHCQHHNVAHQTILAAAAQAAAPSPAVLLAADVDAYDAFTLAVDASAPDPALAGFDAEIASCKAHEDSRTQDEINEELRRKYEAFEAAEKCEEAALVAALWAFPLLMDVAAEGALVEEQMSRAGFFWDDDARTWLKRPADPIEARERMQAVYGY